MHSPRLNSLSARDCASSVIIEEAMPRIFISYRRSDSQAITDRIYERLAKLYGKSNVFLDAFNIPLGADFTSIINQRVASCDILLVIIGTEWLNTKDSNGQRRLDDSNDFVRIEVETGLKNEKTTVIPILVNGGKLPREMELPATLNKLPYRNALEIRNSPYFDGDIRLLLGTLPPPGLWRRFSSVISALLLLVIIGVLGLVASGILRLDQGASQGTIETLASVVFSTTPTNELPTPSITPTHEPLATPTPTETPIPTHTSTLPPTHTPRIIPSATYIPV